MKFNRKITVDGISISQSDKTFIIAEAGVNHNGDLDRAKEMVDVVSEIGVDAVKFQIFKTEDLILPEVKKANYQTKTTVQSESQFEMLKKLEFTKQQFIELKAYCQKRGVIFLVTPFDEGSVDILAEIGVPAYKVASTDTTNLPFLKKVAQQNKPIFFSTGMSYLAEIKLALEQMYSYNQDIILLHCTANYPIVDSEVNLNVIKKFSEIFPEIILGFSDHSVGVGAAPYAVALGAKVIEKHFTLDKNLEGPDHKASLNPQEFKELVQEIRRVEKFLGSFEKEPTNSEKSTRQSLQKCFVAAHDIDKGEIFGEDNIVAKRTGGLGISPIEYKKVWGIQAKRNFKYNEIIEV